MNKHENNTPPGQHITWPEIDWPPARSELLVGPDSHRNTDAEFFRAQPTIKDKGLISDRVFMVLAVLAGLAGLALAQGWV